MVFMWVTDKIRRKFQEPSRFSMGFERPKSQNPALRWSPMNLRRPTRARMVLGWFRMCLAELEHQSWDTMIQMIEILLRFQRQRRYQNFTGWWFGTRFIFPYIGIFIIPTDSHIFQRRRYTTNQYTCYHRTWSDWRLTWPRPGHSHGQPVPEQTLRRAFRAGRPARDTVRGCDTVMPWMAG